MYRRADNEFSSARKYADNARERVPRQGKDPRCVSCRYQGAVSVLLVRGLHDDNLEGSNLLIMTKILHVAQDSYMLRKPY